MQQSRMKNIIIPSSVAMGGLQIVLRATFKTDDSSGFFFLVSTSIFKRTMSFLINHLRHQQLQMKKNHTLVTMKRTFQLRWLMMKQKRTSTTSYHCHWQWNYHKTGLGSKIEITTAKWSLPMFLSFVKSRHLSKAWSEFYLYHVYWLWICDGVAQESTLMFCTAL